MGLKTATKGQASFSFFFLRMRKNLQMCSSVEKAIASQGKRWLRF